MQKISYLQCRLWEWVVWDRSRSEWWWCLQDKKEQPRKEVSYLLFCWHELSELLGAAWIYERLASMWWAFLEWKESWAFQIYCPAGPKLLWAFTPLYVTRQQKEAAMSRLFLYGQPCYLMNAFVWLSMTPEEVQWKSTVMTNELDYFHVHLVSFKER